MKKENFEINFKIKKFAFWTTLFSVIYVIMIFLISDYSVNSNILETAPLIAVCEIIFVIYSLFYFRYIFQKTPFMKPYQNILHMIPISWFAFYGITTFLLNAEADRNVGEYYIMYSIPLIIGLVGIVVGFVFDGVRKVILNKKAKPLN